MRRAMVVLLLGVGCRTPYQAEATLIGGGAYAIQAEMDGAATEGIAHEYAMQRAREVCPAGFDLVDDKTAKLRRWRGLRRIDSSTAALVVRCRPTP